MMGANPREELVPKLFAPALACLAALGLASCTPTTPTQTPRPEPTFQCTPEAGGTPMPCTQQQHDDMVAKDALYAEAEAVTQRLYAELDKLYRAGGYDELPAPLLALTEGAGRESVLKLAHDVRSAGTRSEGGTMSLLWTKRYVGAWKDGSELALVTCFDARTTITKTPGKPDRPGRMTSDVLFFKRVDGAMKLWADAPSTDGECT